MSRPSPPPFSWPNPTRQSHIFTDLTPCSLPLFPSLGYFARLRAPRFVQAQTGAAAHVGFACPAAPCSRLDRQTHIFTDLTPCFESRSHGGRRPDCPSAPAARAPPNRRSGSRALASLELLKKGLATSLTSVTGG